MFISTPVGRTSISILKYKLKKVSYERLVSQNLSAQLLEAIDNISWNFIGMTSNNAKSFVFCSKHISVQL